MMSQPVDVQTEIEALRACVEAMNRLDQSARQRALQYLNSRYEIPEALELFTKTAKHSADLMNAIQRHLGTVDEPSETERAMQRLVEKMRGSVEWHEQVASR